MGAPAWAMARRVVGHTPGRAAPVATKPPSCMVPVVIGPLVLSCPKGRRSLPWGGPSAPAGALGHHAAHTRVNGLIVFGAIRSLDGRIAAPSAHAAGSARSGLVDGVEAEQVLPVPAQLVHA